MQWFNNFKLGVRLTASFVLLALIVAFVGLRSRAAVTDVGERMAWVDHNVTMSMFTLSSIRRELTMLRGDVWLLVAVRDPQIRAQYRRTGEDRARALQDLLAKYEPTIAFPGERQNYDAFRAAYSSLISDYQRAIAASDDRPEEASLIVRGALATFQEALSRLNELASINQRGGAQKTQETIDFATSMSQ